MKRIAVIGGGTGTFTVLSGLKKYPVELSAVVAMADDGGSTGILRDELGVLPPGDVRQCLVALSRSGDLMRKLMNHRFANGGLKGHNFGNLLLSALEQVTGSFDRAIEKASEILSLEGRVIPTTFDRVKLVAELSTGKYIRGEGAIERADLSKLKRLTLDPRARANPKAIETLRRAHLIIFAPGDLYTSLIPTLLVPGIARAINGNRARKIYICNLMNKVGHTDNFCVQDYAEKIESYLGGKVDSVIYNTEEPPTELLKRYAREGEHLVEFREPNLLKRRYITHPLISRNFTKPVQGDPLDRTLVRHNPDRLAKLIFREFVAPIM